MASGMPYNPKDNADQAVRDLRTACVVLASAIKVIEEAQKGLAAAGKPKQPEDNLRKWSFFWRRLL